MAGIIQDFDQYDAVGLAHLVHQGDEAGLIRLAAQIDKITPWTNRKPKICA